jgi:hypothetical protein
MALQLALYVASGAIVVLAAVLVRVLLRFNLQLDRVVTAVLDLEAGVVIDRLGDLSERAVGIADSPLLAPVLAGNRAAQFIRTGATTFLRALWTGRPQSHPKAKAS